MINKEIEAHVDYSLIYPFLTTLVGVRSASVGMKAILLIWFLIFKT